MSQSRKKDEIFIPKLNAKFTDKQYLGVNINRLQQILNHNYVVGETDEEVKKANKLAVINAINKIKEEVESLTKNDSRPLYVQAELIKNLVDKLMMEREKEWIAQKKTMFENKPQQLEQINKREEEMKAEFENQLKKEKIHRIRLAPQFKQHIKSLVEHYLGELPLDVIIEILRKYGTKEEIINDALVEMNLR